MANLNTGDADDPFDLNRFVQAQAPVYSDVRAELSGGCKRSHWMWFVFPQIDGLGFSATSRRYSIKSLDEAHAYLAHPLLGERLLECTRAVLAVEGRTAFEIFGSPDDMKLQSSMTLFAAISPAGSDFVVLLEKYFNSKRDPRTVGLIRAT